MRCLLAVCVGVMACAHGAGAQCDEWRMVHEDVPRATYSRPMVYHGASGKLVFYGGFKDESAGTWEFDGALWRRVAGSDTAVRPNASHHFATAYDSARGRAVLFGGWPGALVPSGNILNETWEWDGAAWLRRTTSTTPPHRWNPAMAYDQARGVIVMHGGHEGADTFADTWVYDGVDWQVRPTLLGPGQRTAHKLSYDSARQRVVLFGGQQNGLYSGETWEWDGSNWTLIDQVGPGRIAQAMAFDPVRQRTVMFGGQSGAGLLGDTWLWDGQVWQQAAVPGPSPRSGGSLVWDAQRGKCVLFGGRGYPDGALADTWEWDGQVWRQIGWAPPMGRAGMAVVYDTAQQALVVTGGTVRAYESPQASLQPDSDSVYELREGRWARWRQKVMPHTSTLSAGAFDVSRGLALFSVWNGPWEWSNGTLQQRVTPGAPATGGHRAAYDSARGVMVVHGASGTHLFNGTSWTQYAGPSPSPRQWHNMAYDPGRERVVLFGGVGPLSDLWEWDGAGWTNRGVPGPAGRSHHAMAYDPVRRAVVIVGGRADVTPFSDVWAWDGAAWTRLADAPFERWGAGMVYDTASSSLLLFGGGASPSLPSDIRAELWALPSCLPACGPADFDGDGSAGTDADIEAFFACLAGSCCAACWHLGADFDHDGDTGTDADIEAFFRVLAGGGC
jgi:hypothetical protein